MQTVSLHQAREYLLDPPRQAQEFFAACMKESFSRDYPPRAREMLVDYLGRVSV